MRYEMLFGLVLLSFAGILAQNSGQISGGSLLCGIYPSSVLSDPLPPFPVSEFNQKFVLPSNLNSQPAFIIRVAYDSTYGNDSDFGDSSGISKIGIPALGLVIQFGASNATSYDKVVEFNALTYNPSFTPWNITINATITRLLSGGGSFSVTQDCLSLLFNVIYAPLPVRPYEIDGEYLYGNWSDCDRECGTGFQTRSVQCMYNGSEVEFYRCPDPIESNTIQTCNTQNCSTDYYRQFDYFTHRCNNLCGGSTYELRRPEPGCRLGGTNNLTTGCDASTFPNNTILCSEPDYTCSWFVVPYTSSCINGTNITHWYECRTSTGKRLTPQDCLNAGIKQNFSISRKCLGDPLIDSRIQTVAADDQEYDQITVYGSNFSPVLEDNVARLYDVNGTLLPIAAYQVMNVSSNGKTAILSIKYLYLMPYVGQTISLQWWNGNANASQITPFMKVILNGSSKLSPGLFLALLFLLSLYL